MTEPRMDPLDYKVPPKGITPRAWVPLVIVVAIGLGIFGYHRSHKARADRSASIQATIGADSCSSSGFQIISKLNHDKDTIYDCLMSSGNYKCVTEANGIDSDVTATVRLLFASKLGAGKPTCIG